MKKVLYTNCGPNAFMSGNGFKIFKCSVSTTQSERAVAEKYLKNYRLYAGEETPIRLRYTYDENITGNALYLMQQPSGICYATNRAGNYFSQAIFDCGNQDVVPINQFFANGMFFPKPERHDIDGSTRPGALGDYAPMVYVRPDRNPLVEMFRNIVMANSFDILIGAVCDCLRSSKQILLVGNQSSICAIIQLISMALPKQMLTLMTFNTFTDDIEGCRDKILGVAPGTINLSAYSKGEQYIIFDYTKLSSPKTNYGSRAGRYVSEFLASMDVTLINGGIAYCEQYIASKGGLANIGGKLINIVTSLTDIYCFKSGVGLKAGDNASARHAMDLVKKSLTNYNEGFVVQDVAKRASLMLADYDSSVSMEILGDGLFPDNVKLCYMREIEEVNKKKYEYAYEKGNAEGVISLLSKNLEEVNTAFDTIFMKDCSGSDLISLSQSHWIVLWDCLVVTGKDGKPVVSSRYAEVILSLLCSYIAKDTTSVSDFVLKLYGERLRVCYPYYLNNKTFVRLFNLFIKVQFEIYGVRGVATELSNWDNLSEMSSVELFRSAIRNYIILPCANKDFLSSVSLEDIVEQWNFLKNVGMLDDNIVLFENYIETFAFIAVKDNKGSARSLNKKLFDFFYSQLDSLEKGLRLRLLSFMGDIARANPFATVLEYFISKNDLCLSTKVAEKQNNELVSGAIETIAANAHSMWAKQSVEQLVTCYKNRDISVLVSSAKKSKLPESLMTVILPETVGSLLKQFSGRYSQAFDFAYKNGGHQYVIDLAEIVRRENPVSAVAELLKSECFDKLDQCWTEQFLLAAAVDTNFKNLAAVAHKFGLFEVKQKTVALCKYMDVLLNGLMWKKILPCNDIIAFFQKYVKLYSKSSVQFWRISCIVACFSDDSDKRLKSLLDYHVKATDNLDFSRFMQTIKPNRIDADTAKQFDRIFLVK